MKRPESAVEAISPAIGHTRDLLLRPFNLGRWFILGFLTFLQILGEGGMNPLNFNQDTSDPQVQRTGREVVEWMAENLPIVAFLGFFIILFILALVVLFQWLSARATFCYLDAVATGRVEVVRPWKEHRVIADSFFFWRLVFTLIVLFLFILVMFPLVIALWTALRAGETIGFWQVIFSSTLVLVSILAAFVLAIAAAIVATLLVDFVVPVQYMRGSRCSAALREVLTLVRAYPGAFIVYFLMRILLAIAAFLLIILVGCASCCILLCCFMIPVVGQTALQPYYAFVRSFPLFFLRGFGPEYDVFPRPPVPEPPSGPGGAGGPGGWEEGGIDVDRSVPVAPPDAGTEPQSPPTEPRTEPQSPPTDPRTEPQSHPTGPGTEPQSPLSEPERAPDKPGL